MAQACSKPRCEVGRGVAHLLGPSDSLAGSAPETVAVAAALSEGLCHFCT